MQQLTQLLELLLHLLCADARCLLLLLPLRGALLLCSLCGSEAAGSLLRCC
jgi:hypothetical protein